METPRRKTPRARRRQFDRQRIARHSYLTGVAGRSAQQIADEIIGRFGTLENLANQPLERLLEIKGLSDVKIIRIAAAYELARRLSQRRSPR